MANIKKGILDFQKDAWQSHFKDEIQLALALTKINFDLYEKAGYEGGEFLKSIKNRLFSEFKALTSKQTQLLKALSPEIARYLSDEETGLVVSLLDREQKQHK